MLLPSLTRAQAFVDILVCTALIGGWVLATAGVKALLYPEEALVAVETSPAETIATESPPSTAESTPPVEPVSISQLALGGLGCTLAVWAVLKWRRLSWASLGLPRPTWSNMALGLPTLVAAITAHFIGMGLVLVAWPGAVELMTKSSNDILKALPPGSTWKFVLMFTFVGFYEELVFRGFLLTRLRRMVGHWWVAIIISSLIFALPHTYLQQPTVLPSLFLLACVFCVFTVTRKSLYPAMIGHWLFNSAQVAYLHYFVSHYGNPVQGVGS